MSLLARFTDLDVFVIEIADFTDRSSALDTDLSHFAGRESHLSVIAFLRHQLSAVSCGSYQLSAFARLEFHIVDHCTYRNVFQRKSVSDFDVSVRAGYDSIAYLQLVRSDDISLFAVSVEDESDVCTSVRIVFDCR